MKSLRSLLIAIVLGISLSHVTSGQKNVSEFLDLGVKDATIISKAYLKPYGDILGKTLNGGWYNSADVHKVAGFNFTVGINLGLAPASASTFDVAALLPQMESAWGLKNPDINIAPTVAGEMRTRPVLTLGGADVLTLPNGSGFDKFPMPVIQLGVGLPLKTEISARFVPMLSIPDAGKVRMLGFGLKHSVKEYIPVVKRVPFLSTSVMFGYTNFDSDINIVYNAGTNQSLKIDATGFTSRLLIGANFPFIAIYTGVGYGTTTSDFALKGDYMVNSVNFYNPISIGYKTTGFDANAGLRLRMGIIALHGDYTFGEYNMATVGIGISFR